VRFAMPSSLLPYRDITAPFLRQTLLEAGLSDLIKADLSRDAALLNRAVQQPARLAAPPQAYAGALIRGLWLDRS